MIRAIVVDDSAFMRKAISTMLQSDAGIEVVATARNGREGVELVAKHKPDVVTMDVEMPEMDGLTALRRIMAETPTHVIMISSLTTDGSHAALTAMKFGAADVFAKEASTISLNITKLQPELVERVKALAQAGKKRFASKAAPGSACVRADAPAFKPGQFDLLCIGSSTGGPPVLEQVLRAVPASFRGPVIAAQHMPEMFTRSMAERLGEQCGLPVKHVENGMPLAGGVIHICPGGKNTHIRRGAGGRMTLLCNQEPAGTLYKPSVDVLLSTAAAAAGARTLAIILTGMGDDGVRGARELHAKGGVILAQNEETCVVYGMPRAVVVENLAMAALPPAGLARSLSTLGAAQAAA
ncbi:MAG TPA: chemotaxis response regulator protein-glutamate methylesterase [Phycisphaerales bacterium]|nr:chemotaxis response regulator protein-glutamate methylesterase [Phycisphaerales bacterium]